MKKIRYLIFIFFVILPFQTLKSEIIIMSACDDKQDESADTSILKGLLGLGWTALLLIGIFFAEKNENN